MAALAVSFGLQFREAFDIAHLKKKIIVWKSSSTCTKPFWSECFLVLPISFVFLWDLWYQFCFPNILSDCDQWANVLHVWYGDDFRSVCLLDLVHFVYSVQVPLQILKIMLVMFSNVEKWSRLQISFCIVCLFDDCVQLYILCLLKNECLPF